MTRNGGRGNRRRTWQLLAACGGVLLAGIVFFVGTGEGRVEITVNHPDVKVSVDGEPHQIKVLDGTTDEYRIELPNIPAGRREIVVTRDGFAAVTRHFWITRNGERAFEMRLVPVASESDTNTAVIASRNDKPDPETPRAAVVNNLGPAENILPGLIPRPTTIPGIKRWNIESRAIRSNVSELAYSPDGELLACGTYSGRVRVYEARTGELVNVLTGEPSPIWALAWSPDSQTLAVGSQNGVLLRWTRDGARIPRRFHSRATADIAWSRDGLVLAVAGVDRVDFVDANQASVQTIDMPGSEIRSAAFSSDGQRFVIGFANGDVSFWNRTSGLEVSHDAHRNGVQTVAWDPTGDVIATGSDDGKVKLWNSDGTPRAVLDGHQSAVTDLDWHPTGDSLVSVDASEVIYRWSKTGELLERRQSPAGKVPYAIVWAPDGDYYSVAGGGRRIVHLPEATTTPESIQGHDLRLTDLEWDSAGARFATAGSDSFVRVFDRDAKPSLFIKTPSKVKGLAWSPDDKQLATSQGKAIVQIWNLTTRRETNSLRPLGGNHTLYSVAWNSITGELAVASANQSATVWRLPNESSPLQRMHNGRVECAEWVPNSKLLVTAGDGADAQIGEPGKGVLALRAGANAVKALSCSPDGKLIAAISDHLTLDVWKTDGTRITSRAVDSRFLGDAIDWSRDSKTLFALGGHGRLVHLGVDAKVKRDVPLHHTIPTAIAVHRDGHEALSADNAGTIIKWSTETLDPEWVLVTMPEGESLQFSASGELLRGNHELFEREFVYVIEDETGRRHLLTPSEFEHRRSRPGDFSVSDEHADRRFAQWVLDRGGRITATGGAWPELKSADDVAASKGNLQIAFSNQADFTDADLTAMSRLATSRTLNLLLDGTSLTADGVSRLRDFNLYELNLARTPVSDNVVEALLSLKPFRALNLSHTKVSSEIFTGLSRLPNLETLSISGIRIESATLANLRIPSLKNLSMIETNFDPESIGSLDGLPALEILQLASESKPFDDDSLRVIGSRISLWYLTLFGTRITDSGLKHLRGLSRQERLELSGSQLTDAGVDQLIVDHPNLMALEIGGSNVTDDGLARLSEFNSLMHLGISDCDGVGAAGFAHVMKLENLEVLIMNETAVSDSDMPALLNLKSLKYLVIKRTAVSDASIEYLSQLKSIKELYIAETRITPAGVARLRAALPNCNISTK